MTYAQREALYIKLQRGVTWDELTHDEHFAMYSLQSADYLYHEHNLKAEYQPETHKQVWRVGIDRVLRGRLGITGGAS